jgi:hypothetical protein
VLAEAATVVWLARGDAPATPSARAKEALAAWGVNKGLGLAEASTDVRRRVAIDWSAAQEVDDGLSRVREALAAVDLDAAERELAHAEATLRDHPELPQAAWLRAEVDRAWAARWAQDGDTIRAERAWARAAGLDGGRAAGLGETATPVAPAITASIAVGGDARAVRLWLDGRSVAPGEVRTTEGEHALAMVTLDGGVAWADWVSFAQGTLVRLTAPEAPACSADDVAHATLDGDVVAAAGVRCAAWVAAVETQGELRVARCAAGTCEALSTWQAMTLPLPRGPVAPLAADVKFHWPSWATWTLTGVTVVGAGVAIAAAAGAFKTTAPQETQFVNGGLVVHSF